MHLRFNRKGRGGSNCSNPPPPPPTGQLRKQRHRNNLIATVRTELSCSGIFFLTPRNHFSCQEGRFRVSGKTAEKGHL